MNAQSLMVWAVQSTLLLGVAGFACSILRRSPSARLIICRSALVGTLVLLFVSPWSYYRSQPVFPISVGSIRPEAFEMPIGMSPVAVKPPRSQSKLSTQVQHSASPEPAVASEPRNVNFAILILGAWLIGVVCLTSWLGLGYWRLRRFVSKTRIEIAGRLFEAVDAASNSFACRRPEVRVGQGITSPFVAGIVRPTLFVPEGWAEKQSEDCLAAVCRHEVAHVASNDLRWSLLDRAAAIVLWPQPLIWLMGKLAAAASEEVCDAKVLASGCTPGEYATTLLNLRQSLQMARPAMSIGIGAVSIRSGFGRRIESIMNYQKGTGLLSRKRALFAMGSVVVIALATTLCAMPKHSGQGGAKAIAPWAKVSGTIAVKLVTPDGKLSKAFAGILFDNFRDSSQWVDADIVNGVVHADLSRYSSNYRAVLVAIVPGYGISFKRVWPVEKPVTELNIHPAVRLVGSVLRPDGMPETNAPVEVRLISETSAPGFPGEYLLPNKDLKALLGTKTDANGKFELSNMPEGGAVQFDVVDPKFASCQGDGAYFNNTKLLSSPTTVAKTVYLRPAAEFTGRVIRDGKPVADIRITAQGNFEAGSDDGIGGEAVTDANGNYKMGRLYPGRYNISYDEHRLNGEVTAVAHENVKAEEGKSVSGLNFDLIPGAIVKGKITDASGSPVYGAQVGIYGPAHPHSSPGVQTVTTGPDGTYVLHVPAGEQYIYLMNTGDRNGQAKTIKVENGTTTVQDFQIN